MNAYRKISNFLLVISGLLLISRIIGWVSSPVVPAISVSLLGLAAALAGIEKERSGVKVGRFYVLGGIVVVCLSLYDFFRLLK